MFIDARHLALEANHLQSDVCIVGAGPAGITLALDLMKHGLKVNVLESGGFERDHRTQALYAGKNVGATYFPLDAARIRQFAGSTNHLLPHGLRSRPLDSLDFEVRDWIPNSGWPFKRSHLDPYYERAQAVCGLGPYEYEIEAWDQAPGEDWLVLESGKLRTTVLQFGPREVFANYRNELARSTAVTVYLNANVVELECDEVSGNVSGVRARTLEGRTLHAHAKVYVLAMGGIENARLLLTSRERHGNGIGNQNDLVGRFFMEHLHVLSGKVVPNRRNLIKQSRIHSQHASHGTEILGALTLAPDAQREARIGNLGAVLYPEDSDSSSRGAIAIRDLLGVVRHYHTHSGLGRELRNLLADSDHRHALGMLTSNLRSVPGDSMPILRTLRRKLAGRYRADPEHLLLGITSEQVPNPESRLTLAASRDRLGQNTVQLDWKITEQDVRTIIQGQEVVDLELRRAGLGSLHAKYAEEKPPPRLGGSWHHMGTTRMHEDPKRGVVDADCRIHGISNLYIAGSSVFPTGGFANPTLTIVALALRLATHLKCELESGKSLSAGR